MSQRALVRQLRKQMLQLEAAQHRAALKAALGGLGDTFGDPAEEASARSRQWTDIATSLLSVVLPARWNRMLNLGVTAWRVGSKLYAKTGKKGATPARSSP